MWYQGWSQPDHLSRTCSWSAVSGKQLVVSPQLPGASSRFSRLEASTLDCAKVQGVFGHDCM